MDVPYGRFDWAILGELEHVKVVRQLMSAPVFPLVDEVSHCIDKTLLELPQYPPSGQKKRVELRWHFIRPCLFFHQDTIWIIKFIHSSCLGISPVDSKSICANSSQRPFTFESWKTCPPRPCP